MARLTSKKVVWFPIPGDEDGAKLQILHLKPGDVQAIEAKTSRWLGRSQNKEFVTELELKPTEQLKLTRLAAIVGWEGFYDEAGVELICTDANKEMYLFNDPLLGKPAKKFSEWIDEFRTTLADEMKPQEEKAEGN